MADDASVTPPAGPVLSIGVWIESVPDVDLRGEGIARTLAAILRSLASRPDTRIVVALAKWSEAGFRRLLEDWEIPADRVTIVVSRKRDPIVIRLRRRGPSGPGLRQRLAQVVKRAAKAAASRSVVRNLVGVSSVTAAVLLAIVAAPIALVLLGAAVIAAALGWALRAGLRAARVVAGRVLARLGISRAFIVGWLRDALIENEFLLLARRAESTAAVDVWFVPYPGAAYASGLSAPKVVAVPDLVYVEFPTLFDPAWIQRVDERVRRLVPRAASIVTYSRRVAERHVAAHLGIPGDRVHVIRHAPFESVRALDAAAAPGEDRRSAAVRTIAEFLDDRRRPDAAPDGLADYIAGLPFGEIEFLFVPSQVRPTKNYLNLFRAVERLVRRRFRNVKLVITGLVPRNGASGLRDYLDDQRLDLDILSVPNLPSAVHAAFMHLAALTVVPTLFEGGFPFPFSESLSVETPVVMSGIPVTREVIPEALQPLMLFDPYDVERITERIEWALDHRAALLDLQRPLQAALSLRTWDVVAGEYRAQLAAAAATRSAGSAAGGR